MVGDCVSLPACILCGVRVCVCCVLEMCHRNQSMGHGSDHDPSTPLVIDKNPVFHLQHLIPHPSPELNFNETKNSFIMSSDMSGNVVKTPTGLKVNGSEKLDYNFHYVSPVFDISHAKLAETYKPWGRVLIVLDKSEFSVRFGRSPTCRARMFS